jgi:hypothetical protein
VPGIHGTDNHNPESLPAGSQGLNNILNNSIQSLFFHQNKKP